MKKKEKKKLWHIVICDNDGNQIDCYESSKKPRFLDEKQGKVEIEIVNADTGDPEDIWVSTSKHIYIAKY